MSDTPVEGGSEHIHTKSHFNLIFSMFVSKCSINMSVSKSSISMSVNNAA